MSSWLLLQVQIFQKQYHRGTLYNRGMGRTFTWIALLFESWTVWFHLSNCDLFILQFENLVESDEVGLIILVIMVMVVFLFLSALLWMYCSGAIYIVKDRVCVLWDVSSKKKLHCAGISRLLLSALHQTFLLYPSSNHD